MKNLLVFFLICLLSPSVFAQFNDHDGQLTVSWAAPDYGNTLDHYIWSYTINGVADSVSGSSPSGASTENSVVLANIGDWAVFSIRAVSVINDTSVVAVTDTAFYDTEQGIGPPLGVNWIQGP